MHARRLALKDTIAVYKISVNDEITKKEKLRNTKFRNSDTSSNNVTKSNIIN